MTNSSRLIRGALSRYEVDALNAQAWGVRRSDPGRAAELSRLTRSRAEATAYRRGVGQARVVEAFLAARAERADLALESGLAALADLEPDGPTSWLAWAHSVIGAVCRQVGEKDRAAQHYRLAYDTATLADDAEAAAASRLNAALLREDPTKQLPLLTAAVTAFETAGTPDGLGYARYNLAECLLDVGRVAEARELAARTAEQAREPGTAGVRLACRVVEARARAAAGDDAGAAEHIRAAMTEAPDADLAVRVDAGRHLARLQCEAGDLSGALASLLALEAGLPADSPYTVDLAREISEHHARLGDFDAAYAALRRHQEQRHAVSAERTRRRVAILEVLYQTREAEAAAGMQRALADELDGRVARLTQLTEATQDVGDEDPLTGLPLRARLEAELATLGARTTPVPVALVLVDLDELAGIGAELGHLVADTAVRQVARLLETAAPAGSLLARLDGGQAFALLLDRTTLGEAERVAGRLRAAVDGHPMPAELHGRVLTVSTGVAEAISPFDPERLLRVADDALYAAKDGDHGAAALPVSTSLALGAGPADR